jgi:beta-galactosidase
VSEELFTQGWSVAGVGGQPVPVDLPHDAMIAEARVPGGGAGRDAAFFPGGAYSYLKRWTAPDDADTRRISLFFEGVYGTTRVLLDGSLVTENVSGYREFEAVLDGLRPGAEHVIEVVVDNSAVPNSRWYTGSGIYRPVWLRSVPKQQRLRPGGVTFSTLRIAPTATLLVDVEIVGDRPGDRVRVTLNGGGSGTAAATAAVADGRAQVDLDVPDARLWSAESPHLYNAVVTLEDTAGAIVDQLEQRIGIRTLDVDARRGLRVNGTPVLLRGACVHHDNGLLGAATFAAAERRRVAVLKANGFNAVRSSHNPLSRSFLDACDELGLYVMDETTDYWRQRKSAHDLADRFDELWRDDARSMVEKDLNHPSVIMYCIGNEIPETASPEGVGLAEEIGRHIGALDPSRPTTVAVNMMVNLMASRGRNVFAATTATAEDQQKKADSSTAANIMANKLGSIMGLVSRLPAADKASKDAFAAVDVAGYNYAFSRYAGDRKRYPERVILGTESMPGDLPKIWRLVEQVPGVIGDFMWTGWDYLGEVGIGTWTYGDDKPGLAKQYPHLVAGCGAIDITGEPGAPTLLARAVWGQLDAPAIAVRPVDHSGEATNRVAWRGTDAMQSWAWTGLEGRTAEIEVYSSDDEVELLLNGRRVGRKRAGTRVGFVTRFRVPWEQGELVAVGYRSGRETGRSSLRSAGTAQLRLTPEVGELVADGHDLAFVKVELADERGIVAVLERDEVSLTVSGSGRLIAFGSAEPATEETFTGARHSTHRGRALAVVRAASIQGSVVIEATSAHHGTARLELPVRASVVESSEHREANVE